MEMAKEAVLSCAVCRKHIRCPNRPQTRLRAGGAHSFDEAIQLDLFDFEGLWFMIMLDEATRFKTYSVLEGQEAEQLLDCLFKSWIYMFDLPTQVIMDQQMSLMSHEAGVEFERLGMTRQPRGS